MMQKIKSLPSQATAKGEEEGLLSSPSKNLRNKFWERIALILGVLTMSFLVGYLVLAWTEPTATPPGGNVAAPLNVSLNAQSKEGALVIGTNSGLTTGLIVQYGNVGIGTTGPNYKLDVNGDINLPAAGFLRIAGSAGASGQVLTRTATGMAWQAAAGGGGTVTQLNQGTGIILSPNPITTTGSISADTTYLQRRVTGTCAAGSSIRVIASDGTVTCETDDVGGAGIGGSGTTTQVAFFTAATTIGSDSGLYWDNTNKRLGIGTTGPGAKLDVSGNIRSSTFVTANGLGEAYGGQGGMNANYYHSATNDSWFAYPGNNQNYIRGVINTNNAIIAEGYGTIRDAGGGWVRTYGNTGWYSQTYGGGWFMQDTTWIRAYNNKNVYTPGEIQAGTIRGNSQVCIGTDCRSSWPVAGGGVVIEVTDNAFTCGTQGITTLYSGNCNPGTTVISCGFYFDLGSADNSKIGAVVKEVTRNNWQNCECKYYNPSDAYYTFHCTSICAKQ